MNQGDLVYWIWLSECVGQATHDFRVLHDLYEDPYDIYSASAAEL